MTSEDTGYPITTLTFKFLTSNVISMVKLFLSVDSLTDQSTAITGLTNSNANIQVEYLDQTKTTTANSYGSYTLDLENKIAINTPVKISANTKFLTKWLTITVDGSVAITSLSSLNFKTFTSQSNQSVIFRQNPDWNIQVTDTRTQGGNWYLYAYILSPLTSSDHNLKDILIYKKDDVEYVLSKTPQLVYTVKSEESPQTTLVTWENIEGFLLKLETSKTYPSGDYQTEILWQVSPEPLD